MKLFLNAALSLVLAVWPCVTSAEDLKPSGDASIPQMPGCTCSEGGEIKYPESSTGKVFIANCVCGTQACAVTWGKTQGIDCSPGGSSPPDNCANFSALPRGETNRSTMTVGGFTATIVSDPSDGMKTFVIKNYPAQENAVPNYLAFASDGAEIELVFPLIYKKATIDFVSFMNDTSKTILWKIETGEFKTWVNEVANPGNAKSYRFTVMDAKGIRKIRLPRMEGGLFQLCAYDFSGIPNP